MKRLLTVDVAGLQNWRMSVRKAAERYTASNVAPRVARWRLGGRFRRVVYHVLRCHTVLTVVVANVSLLVLKRKAV